MQKVIVFYFNSQEDITPKFLFNNMNALGEIGYESCTIPLARSVKEFRLYHNKLSLLFNLYTKHTGNQTVGNFTEEEVKNHIILDENISTEFQNFLKETIEVREFLLQGTIYKSTEYVLNNREEITDELLEKHMKSPNVASLKKQAVGNLGTSPLDQVAMKETTQRAEQETSKSFLQQMQDDGMLYIEILINYIANAIKQYERDEALIKLFNKFTEEGITIHCVCVAEAQEVLLQCVEEDSQCGGRFTACCANDLIKILASTSQAIVKKICNEVENYVMVLASCLHSIDSIEVIKIIRV